MNAKAYQPNNINTFIMRDLKKLNKYFRDFRSLS